MENINNFKKRLLDINKNWGAQLSIFIAIILLVIIFSASSKYFFTIRNLTNIGFYMAIVGVMAAGCSVALITGLLDISQYSILALIGVSCLILDKAGVSIGFIFLFSLFGGIILGAINGFIVTILKINPIIGTLASGMVMRGFTYFLASSRTFTLSPNTKNIYLSFGRGTILGIPYILIVMAVVYLIIFIILKHTKNGRYIFAVGSNSNAAFLAGISLKKIRFLSLMIAGATAGIGAFLLLSEVGSIQPMTGENALMDVITAVLLGGIALSGGSGKLTGTIFGVITIVLIQNGMTLLGVQTYWQMIVRGLIVILAIYIDSLRGHGYK